MAAVKTNQTLKRTKKLEKREKIDKATNWFMINLAWGILAIIVLAGIQNKIMITPKKAFIPAIIFAVVAVGLFVCGKLKVLKNTKRVNDYAWFSAVITLVSLYIGLYTKIRVIAGGLIPSLLNVDSRVWVGQAPITLIGIYLVVAFVVTTVKIATVERKK